MLASETSENVLFCILPAGSFSPFDSFSFSFEKTPSVLCLLASALAFCFFCSFCELIADSGQNQNQFAFKNELKLLWVSYLNPFLQVNRCTGTKWLLAHCYNIESSIFLLTNNFFVSKRIFSKFHQNVLILLPLKYIHKNEFYQH